MPWKEVSLMSQREEFVALAGKERSNVSELCRRYGISRKTGYKWLERYEQEGRDGLVDHSRKPGHSPRRTGEETEKQVLALRDLHPVWGGRKLRARLQALGHIPPAASTITQILRRNGRLDNEECKKHKTWERFEHEAPNDLWQMDFKGDFAMSKGGRCHTLTVIDDHSRYALCTRACRDQRRVTVEAALTDTFHTYGLPERMLMDNWGYGHGGYTKLSAWLIRLGVSISHGRPYHPQTQGKNERFNRTLKAEVISARSFRDLEHCQTHYDRWRVQYNIERPHEALGLLPPISRYSSSKRQYPEALPSIVYGPDDTIRKVNGGGDIHFRSKRFFIGEAFYGNPVALRPTLNDDVFKVYFCHQKITEIDLRNGSPYGKGKRQH